MIRNFCAAVKIGLTALTVLLAAIGIGYVGNDSPAAGSNNHIQLLNNRAAAIIGSTPLTGRNFVPGIALTGKGQIIGLADSGLDSGRLDDLHPDLQSTPGQMPKIVWLRSWAGRVRADDPIGHGTHMAATLVGSGQASAGQFQGVAPGASLYVQGLLNQYGEMELPADLSGLFAPAYDAGVRIHVDGWGGGANRYGSESAQIDAFSRLYPDFLPIFGAGNSGPGVGTLTTEANSKNALVVGASQVPRPALGGAEDSTLQPAAFSSLGPTGDGRIKPELLVPGSNLISACSQLVAGNYPANDNYTILSGTSMSAAVSGGAAVLLRQYLLEKADMKQPSAALLKAALINGAQTVSGSAGYGVLDLTATVLALEEDQFQIQNPENGLSEKEELNYIWSATDSRSPLKATLVWTDPPAAPGSGQTLINDLDLEVQGPGGQIIYGNHLWRRSGASGGDRINNVEQVVIEQPAAGRYQITVRAHRIGKDTLASRPGEQQDFALVYGQPLLAGALQEAISQREVQLAGASATALPAPEVRTWSEGAVDNRLPSQLPEGSQVYIGSRRSWAVVQRWQGVGVQALCTVRGPVLMESNQQAREGGYYLASPAMQSFRLNGRWQSDLSALITGSQVTAEINPRSQRIWRLQAWFERRTGIIREIDRQQRTLTLFAGNAVYPVHPDATVSFVDTMRDSDPSNAPFGAGEPGTIEQVLPGMTVEMVISPLSQEVQYISVQREVAMGWVRSVDAAGETLVVEGSRRVQYHVFPQATIFRDGLPVPLAALQPGDHLQMVLLPGAELILQGRAESRPLFAQILFHNEKLQAFNLLDYTNHFYYVHYQKDSRFFRWGVPVRPGSLTAGSWCRLSLDETRQEIMRMDVAEGEQIINRVLGRMEANTVRLDDGAAYLLHPYTLVTLEGYRMETGDLSPGQHLQLDLLRAPEPYPVVVAAINAETSGEIPPPRLEVTGWRNQNGPILAGNTEANRIYLYVGGERQTVPLDPDGRFSVRLPPTVSGAVQVVALDTRNGALASRRLQVGEIDHYGFSDLDSAALRQAVEALAVRGLVEGYPDGRFYPERQLTRVEAVGVLVRMGGWPASPEDPLPAADGSRLAAWSRPLVAAALSRGLITAYPDGAFRPDEVITRAELAVLIDRYLALTGNPPAAVHSLPPPASAPYLDREEIPVWARAAADRIFFKGIMIGTAYNQFSPQGRLNRGEFAQVLARI